MANERIKDAHMFLLANGYRFPWTEHSRVRRTRLMISPDLNTTPHVSLVFLEGFYREDALNGAGTPAR